MRVKRKGPGRRMAAATGMAIMLAAAPGAQAAPSYSFNMVRSAGLPAGCAPRATARVRIETLGFAERMTVWVSGLPANTELDLFTIQVPNVPFGIGWYMGDLKVGWNGTGSRTFVSRLNKETFAVAVGEAVAPKPHGERDAGRNPAFQPIHTFHLGFWFNSPEEARRAGCPDFVTPFNGDHTAGLQVLSTRNFGDRNGPLRQVD